MNSSFLNSPNTGVIVTGGASGIGRACAEALAAVGRPVAIWDLDNGQANAVAEDIASRFEVTATGFGIDLTATAGIDDAVAATRQALPNIGGLVHAAGVSLAVPLAELGEAQWDAVLNVNLRALPFIARAIRADLIANPGSAIVGIGSINATLGNATVPAYTASKGGLLALARSMADDFASDGIRVNSVSPGHIVTSMMQPVIDAQLAGQFERRILLGRIGKPVEVGRAVRFLLSDEASYITAAELVVDGGNISSQRFS